MRASDPHWGGGRDGSKQEFFRCGYFIFKQIPLFYLFDIFFHHEILGWRRGYIVITSDCYATVLGLDTDLTPQWKAVRDKDNRGVIQ
jgi:hypothetical protein